MVKMRHPHVDERPNSATYGAGIDGTLDLALEDGSVFSIPIIAGIMEVPEEHVQHVLAGVHGSSIVPIPEITEMPMPEATDG